MVEIKWIKITTGIFDNEKIKLIETLPEADSLIVIWFKILCLAGRTNMSGLLMMNDRIYYTDEMLASLFNRPLNTVRLALKTFQEFGMVEMINDTYYISNWEKHQNVESLDKVREQTRKRVQRHRQKLLAESAKCNVTRNVTETLTNAIEKELDKEEEEDKEKEIRTTIPSSGCDSDFNIFLYMQKRGFVSISPIMAEKINADIEMYSLEEVRTAIDIADENGIHKYSYIEGILKRRRAGVDEKKDHKKEVEDALANWLNKEG